nr:hypothetical protein [Tanacetum cinerariifolium]
MKTDDYVATIKEEAKSAKAALIEKKGKSVMEVSNTPITTPTRFPRIPLSSDKEKLQELTDSLEPTSTNITFLKAI